MYDSHSASSLSRWTPQMGSTLSNWDMNAMAARLSAMRPPARPFMATKPTFARRHSSTSSRSRGPDR